ncbi:hypothetical protein H5410_062839 [Solanum commersonii]|uniref:Secreted protein n=1 Tax=Solanum commersonii TaxID=4109 RepID=A0A9J5WBR2_SOLCO|nr:hypothetical protein H5410_062839 [Solanum commersonii]
MLNVSTRAVIAGCCWWWRHLVATVVLLELLENGGRWSSAGCWLLSPVLASAGWRFLPENGEDKEEGEEKRQTI